MKGKIDKGGALWIERCGKMMIQFCPYGKYGDHCGHQCPLFGDPSNENEGGHITLSIDSLRSAAELIKRKQGVAFFIDESNAIPEGIGVSLQLCHKTLIFSEFDDERG